MRNGQNDHNTVQNTFFSMNLTKYAKKTRDKMFYTFADMTSLTPDSKL